MKHRHIPLYKAGLSLVELLIALGIFTAILAVLTVSWIQTGGLVNDLVTESDLMEDARNASAIIADGINRAAYVYPPGSSLQLNATPGQLLHNPIDGSNTFVVGNYVGSNIDNVDNIAVNTATPIIAFLEAEQNPDVACSDPPTEGCLTFIAYYFAKRGDLTGQGNAYPFLEDKNNEDKWMLLEYRKRVQRTSENLQNAGVLTDPTNGQAQLLLDYVDPNYLYVYFNDCGTGSALNPLEKCLTTADLTNVNKTVVNGRVTFRSGITRRNRLSLTPTMTFSIAPRNLINNLLR